MVISITPRTPQTKPRSSKPPQAQIYFQRGEGEALKGLIYRLAPCGTTLLVPHLPFHVLANISVAFPLSHVKPKENQGDPRESQGETRKMT